MWQPIKHSIYEECRGAILVLFALMAAAIFAVVGLALDAGNLYNARLSTQLAADAAAISGMGVRISMNLAPGAIAEAERSARETARVNMISNMIGPSWFNFTPDDNTGDVRASLQNGVMRVSVSANVPLYLMGGLPGISTNRWNVTSYAEAQLNPANVSLVLDTSDSMACPTVPPNAGVACPCVPNCPQGINSGAKIQALRRAVQNFITFFDPGNDALNLVAFGHAAEVLVPFRGGGVMQYSPADFARALNPATFTAQGATNTFDGLFSAYWDARVNQHLNDIHYVYFSDGAPTAGRFFIDRRSIKSSHRSRTSVKNNQLVGSPSWADYDYLDWGVVDITQDADGNNLPVRVPGTLYKTPPKRSGGGNRGGTGGYNYWDSRQFAGVDPPSGLRMPSTYRSINEPWRAFRGSQNVLRSMTVRMPDNSIRRLGRGALWDGNSFVWGNWIPEQDHMWIYADLGTHMADFVRAQGGRVYAIGFGPGAGTFDSPAGVSCDGQNGAIHCGDPYQDVSQPHLRKDIYARRFVNSVCGWHDPPFFGSGILPIQVTLENQDAHGTYYSTSNEEQLRGMFEKIAIKIKMRMIS